MLTINEELELQKLVADHAALRAQLLRCEGAIAFLQQKVPSKELLSKPQEPEPEPATAASAEE